MKALNALYSDFIGGRAGIGLLALRVVSGLALMVHGYPKIMHPFSWMGDGLPGILQACAAVAEFFGGLALVLGLLIPIACIGVFITMATAILMVHVAAGDPWIGKGRAFEPALSYLVTALTLFLTGPGKYSLDHKLFGRDIPTMTPVTRVRTRMEAVK